MNVDLNQGVAMDHSHKRAGRRFARGFTLVELMVVVAIVAILAGIALPSYQDSVRKSRRAQAKADLVEIAQGLERFHSVNNSYVGYALPFKISPRVGGATQYNLAAANLGATTFALTATPVGAQTSDSCGALTVNQAGVKGSAGPIAECW